MGCNIVNLGSELHTLMEYTYAQQFIMEEMWSLSETEPCALTPKLIIQTYTISSVNNWLFITIVITVVVYNGTKNDREVRDLDRVKSDQSDHWIIM